MQSLPHPFWQRRLAASLSTTTVVILLSLILTLISYSRPTEAVDTTEPPTWGNESIPTLGLLTNTNTDNGQGISVPEFAAYYDDNAYDDADADADAFERRSNQEQSSDNYSNNIHMHMVPRDLTALGNNQFIEHDLKIGETQWWYFPKKDVNGNKSTEQEHLPQQYPNGYDLDQNTGSCLRVTNGSDTGGRSPRVFLSMTTCSKPDVNGTNSSNGNDDDDDGLPQLQVYVSVSGSDKTPGPGSKAQNKAAEDGYFCADVTTDGDVYVGVSAPNTTAYMGSYKYHLAASIDGLFHSVVDDAPNLYFLDADVQAALLVSGNLTNEKSSTDEEYKFWQGHNPPYTMFAHDVNDRAIAGLKNSYCALDQHAQVGKRNNTVNASMTTRGLGNQPKEQFYLTSLNRSTVYDGILAVDGNSTRSGNGIIGGGGKVYKAMNFTTKSDGNCAVLFNLNFCSEVAYAVPSNPTIPLETLSQIYDQKAATHYQNFNKSLQQIQCNTSAYPPTSIFSLAVNCTSCAAAYKHWLCAVSIPRCFDFSSSQPYLQPRNTNQSFLNGSTLEDSHPLKRRPADMHSRNGLIDSLIRPGPYKEILPCLDVCHDLVRNCPAKLKFGCPGGALMDVSYGRRPASVLSDDITCNYLGAAHGLRSVANGLGVSKVVWLGLLCGWVVLWVFV